MRHYRLVYKQPYEYDDDSPSGFGDHQVGHEQHKGEFEARSDADARVVISAYLREGGLNFGVHIGSPPAAYYPRQFVSLVEFKRDRVVKFQPTQQKLEEVSRQ